MPTIEEIKEKTKSIFMLYPVNKVSLFGSYAKGTQNEKSDIDFLINVSDMSFLTFAKLKEDLSIALNIKVDLVTDTELSDVFRFLIKDDEVIIYEK